MCGVPLSVSHVRLMLRSQHMTWEGNCLQPPPEGALQRRREGPGGSCTCLPAAITPTPSNHRFQSNSDKSRGWPRLRTCPRLPRGRRRTTSPLLRSQSTPWWKPIRLQSAGRCAAQSSGSPTHTIEFRKDFNCSSCQDDEALQKYKMALLGQAAGGSGTVVVDESDPRKVTHWPSKEQARVGFWSLLCH